MCRRCNHGKSWRDVLYTAKANAMRSITSADAVNSHGRGQQYQSHKSFNCRRESAQQLACPNQLGSFFFFWTQTEQGHPRPTPLSSHDCEHRPAVVFSLRTSPPLAAVWTPLGMLDDTQLYAGHVHLPRKFRLLAMPPETCNWALPNQRC